MSEYHHTEIASRVDGYGFRAYCKTPDCGWEGSTFNTYEAAELDANRHDSETNESGPSPCG